MVTSEQTGYKEAFKPIVTENIFYDENNVAGFEHVFDHAPVIHGFSWGKGSQNMAEFLEKEHIPAVRDRIENFLAKKQMNNLLASALLIPPAEGTALMEVTPEMISNNNSGEELLARANAFFTRSHNIPLLVKPADCPIVLMYAETGKGESLVGMIHAGRTEVDRNLPLATLLYLQKEFGCDPKHMRVGITPSVAPKHYFIKEENEDLLINEEDWGRNLYRTHGKIHLNLLHATLRQLERAGLQEQNIEVYKKDTYESAEAGEAFSHRWATETGQPEKNGRFLVAIQLIK